MKALIINDTPLKKHPFGRLLIESLEKNKIEVLLATSDENLEKPIFDFTNSIKSYLRRKSIIKSYLRYRRRARQIGQAPHRAHCAAYRRTLCRWHDLRRHAAQDRVGARCGPRGRELGAHHRRSGRPLPAARDHDRSRCGHHDPQSLRPCGRCAGRSPGPPCRAGRSGFGSSISMTRCTMRSPSSCRASMRQ